MEKAGSSSAVGHNFEIVLDAIKQNDRLSKLFSDVLEESVLQTSSAQEIANNIQVMPSESLQGIELLKKLNKLCDIYASPTERYDYLELLSRQYTKINFEDKSHQNQYVKVIADALENFTSINNDDQAATYIFSFLNKYNTRQPELTSEVLLHWKNKHKHSINVSQSHARLLFRTCKSALPTLLKHGFLRDEIEKWCFNLPYKDYQEITMHEFANDQRLNEDLDLLKKGLYIPTSAPLIDDTTSRLNEEAIALLNRLQKQNMSVRRNIFNLIAKVEHVLRGDGHFLLVREETYSFLDYVEENKSNEYFDCIADILYRLYPQGMASERYNNYRTQRQEAYRDELFALIMACCDEFLTFKNNLQTEDELKAKRFFEICKKLPMELQQVMANRFADLAVDGISKQGFEAAFRKMLPE